MRAHRLVLEAIECLPPLRGYIGFDLVLGDGDGSGRDVVIEVNPRLTTSYVGLREVSRPNLAGAIIDIALGETAELSFCREPIEFVADGSILHTS